MPKYDREFWSDEKIDSKEFFKKLKTIRQAYGDKPQLIVAMEELAELQQAIAKFLLRKDKQRYAKDMIMEIADVRIMLLHLEGILNLQDKTVWNVMGKKINKHYDMIMEKRSDVAKVKDVKGDK